MDALGKGTGRSGPKAKPKAKAGAFSGQCAYCDKPGHKAADCRKIFKDEASGIEGAKMSNIKSKKGMGRGANALGRDGKDDEDGTPGMLGRESDSERDDFLGMLAEARDADDESTDDDQTDNGSDDLELHTLFAPLAQTSEDENEVSNLPTG